MLDFVDNRGTSRTASTNHDTEDTAPAAQGARHLPNLRFVDTMMPCWLLQCRQAVGLQQLLEQPVPQQAPNMAPRVHNLRQIVQELARDPGQDGATAGHRHRYQTPFPIAPFHPMTKAIAYSVICDGSVLLQHNR